MATKVKKNSDNWQQPKIPVHKLYKKKPFWILRKPSYTIKDFERTFEFNTSDKCISLDLLSLYMPTLKDIFKGHKHRFVHLGLVQVAIKPLVRDGVDAPVIVCLRDSRHLDFKTSLLALVTSNLSQGPLFFNCFPGFTVSMNDAFGRSSHDPLCLFMKTTGIPLMLTVRIVFKAMVDFRDEYLEEPVLGKTIYFHANSGTPLTTQWDEVVKDNESTQRLQDQLMLTSDTSAQGASNN